MLSRNQDPPHLPEPADVFLPRIVIEDVRPSVDGGQVPAKRTVGDVVVASAVVLTDGHEKIAGVLGFRQGRDGPFVEVPLEPVGPGSAAGQDRWTARFPVESVGTWQFTFAAWIDGFATWRWGLERKVTAGQPVDLELREGALLCRDAARRAPPEEARWLDAAALTLGGEAGATPDVLPGGAPSRGHAHDGAAIERRIELALGAELAAHLARFPDRRLERRLEAPFEILVEPARARFSSWYELFPRSTGPAGRHGTFDDVIAHLPYVADMGFDVLYFPPIHPIGRAFRKGPNNTLNAGPGDPGSPWAIGAAEGGHKAVHPQLGTLADFDRLVAAARARGIEVALDIAFQASPDHPYVREHPDWFIQRPDGSIQYAENPPKKYQDVYPFDFTCTDWRNLWRELASVFLFWVDHGVRIFRVDNPHTKPISFWRWCLAQVRDKHPDVVFLSEAFTRPKLMYALAKAGFSQSYTYFTWRTTKAEIEGYLGDLGTGEVPEFFRPNFWPNTPDILPEHLQLGTRGTFIARLVLAATLSPNYGIYGPAFELQERTPREGSEEYIDNEKFQIRSWDLQREGNLRAVIKRINRIRHENPALQHNRGLTFHPTDNDLLIAYSKVDPGHGNVVLTVVSLDPHHRQSGWISLHTGALDLGEDESFQVHDLLSDARHLWRGRRAYVEIDPALIPAHVFRVRRRGRTERQFEYFL